MTIEIIRLALYLLLGVALAGIFYHRLKFLIKKSAAVPVQETDEASLEALQPRAAAMAKIMGPPVKKYEKAMLITKTFHSEYNYVSYDFSAYDKARIVSMLYFSPDEEEEGDWRVYPNLINACVFEEEWVALDDCEGRELCI